GVGDELGDVELVVEPARGDLVVLGEQALEQLVRRQLRVGCHFPGLRGKCLSARGELCGFELALQPERLESALVPALRALLPRLGSSAGHTHDGEDQPPVASRPLPELLHDAFSLLREVLTVTAETGSHRVPGWRSWVPGVAQLAA